MWAVQTDGPTGSHPEGEGGGGGKTQCAPLRVLQKNPGLRGPPVGEEDLWAQYTVSSMALLGQFLTHPLIQSFAHSPSHPVTHPFTRSFSYSPTHPFIQSFTHLPTHPVTHPFTHSSSYSLTHTHNQSLTHSLIYTLIRPPIHSLTHSHMNLAVNSKVTKTSLSQWYMMFVSVSILQTLVISVVVHLFLSKCWLKYTHY